MMTRKITIMALIGGAVLGAAATAGFNVYRQSHDSRIFQERLHCKAVADAYVKAHSTDLNENPTDPNAVVLTLSRVDYSSARNSCLAEVETTRFFSGEGTENESVQDLLSGETLFSVNNTDDFGAFQHLFLPRVWDYVMNNSSQPVELEREWALIESKNPHKSTPPSRVAKPNDWQAIQPSKNPPKSASPSGP